MVAFRCMYGAVYIFENAEAQRVKVGMTTGNIALRLNDVNDMWLGRRVTCQICGRRLNNIEGRVPEHRESGTRRPGGEALPLEKEVALAESVLEHLKSRVGRLAGSEKGSITRKVRTLAKRMEIYRHRDPPAGVWQLRTASYTECAEQVELLSHEILGERLDKEAPFGELFCCSVSQAAEAVERALSELGLLHSARRATRF